MEDRKSSCRIVLDMHSDLVQLKLWPQSFKIIMSLMPTGHMEIECTDMQIN